jgi:AcrR family transcriptional regulator
MSVVANARTRILDVAEGLFAQHGFDGTATPIIAQMAAVPKGLLFYYFPAKKDILATLVGERFGLRTILAAPFVVPGNLVKSSLAVAQAWLAIVAASLIDEGPESSGPGWREAMCAPNSRLSRNRLCGRGRWRAVQPRPAHCVMAGLFAGGAWG